MGKSGVTWYNLEPLPLMKVMFVVFLSDFWFSSNGSFGGLGPGGLDS